jgi:histidinol phosphatase-like enzyme
MVRQAIADWQLDPQRCLLVGDKRADLQAGEACGIAGALFDLAHDDLLETVHRFVLPRLLAATKHSNSYS